MTWKTGTASGRTIDPHAKTTGDDPLSEEDAYRTIEYHLQACEVHAPDSKQEWIEFVGSFSGGSTADNMWFAAAGKYVSAKTKDKECTSVVAAAAAAVPLVAAAAAAASASELDWHPPAAPKARETFPPAAAAAKRPMKRNNFKSDGDDGGDKRLKEAN